MSEAIMKAFLVTLLSIVLSLAAAANYDQFCDQPGNTGTYFVPHPTDCAEFIKCTNGVGQAQMCLEDYWFDMRFNICRPQSVAQCAHVPSDVIPDYVLEICALQDVGVSIPAEDCGRYYVCYGSRAFELMCPNGQHYSRAYSACMNPLLAGCRALNTMCVGKFPGFEFPSLTCENYYECDDSLLPQQQSCGAGLYFSADNQNCTEPDLSGCVNVGVPDETTTTEVTTTDVTTTDQTTTDETTTEVTTTDVTTTDVTTTDETTTDVTTTDVTTTDITTTDITTTDITTTDITTTDITTTDITTVPDDTTPNPDEPNCNASNTGAFFAHPKCDCFYMCYNGLALEFKCECGQYYNAELEYCVQDTNNVCLIS